MCSMAMPTLLAVSSLVAVSAQQSNFCLDGKSDVPAEWDNAVGPSIEVIYLQTPLFATNPKIGQKGKLLNLYHTAIALRQTDTMSTAEQRYWTLEFDVQDFNGLPQIEGETLTWNIDARFCFTEGLLHSREHWTTHFNTVAHITGAQARAALEQAVFRYNGTGVGTKPFYELWDIKPSKATSPTIRDVTCADGANWFLHHIQSELKVPLGPQFKFKVTKAKVHCEELVPVDANNPAEWSAMVRYYKEQTEFVKGGGNIFERFVALLGTFPCKYVYDANEDVYYRIYGNRFPYFDFEYEEVPLTASPYANGIVEV